MRTTLTLDDEIARRLKEAAHRERKPFKQVVNDTLRAGLHCAGKRPAGGRRFTVKPRHMGFHPGVDQGKLNQLADELEAAEFAAEAGEQRG